MIESRTKIIYKSDSIDFASQLCRLCGEAKPLNCFLNKEKGKSNSKSEVCKKCLRESSGEARFKRVNKNLLKNKGALKVTMMDKDDKVSFTYINDDLFELTSESTLGGIIKKDMTLKQCVRYCIGKKINFSPINP